MAAGPFEREIAQLSDKYARNSASRIFAPLADAYRKAGRLDEAITVGQQGLRHHPDYVGGRMVLARTYFDRGDLELASAEFRRVLDSDQQNLVALRALGEISRQQGDALGAESWYRRALDIDPTNLEIQERLDELSVAPAPDAAASFAEEPSAVETAPAEADSWAGGWGSPGSESERGADRESGARVTEPPGAPEEIATVTLAEIYAEQGLHERALGIYRRILVEDPGNAPIRERAERLEARIGEERARLDAEAGAALGGFVPGELQLTGDEVLTSEPPADFVTEAEAAPEEAAFPETAPRRPTPEPWAFLLHDEADADPEEVFGAGPRSATATHSEPARPAPKPAHPGPQDRAEPAPPGAGGEDEDLRKFQEWLRSLQ